LRIDPDRQPLVDLLQAGGEERGSVPIPHKEWQHFPAALRDVLGLELRPTAVHAPGSRVGR
jgi:hypothetical protein